MNSENRGRRSGSFRSSGWLGCEVIPASVSTIAAARIFPWTARPRRLTSHRRMRAPRAGLSLGVAGFIDDGSDTIVFWPVDPSPGQVELLIGEIVPLLGSSNPDPGEPTQ
jgi:hypothetical protein